MRDMRDMCDLKTLCVKGNMCDMFDIFDLVKSCLFYCGHGLGVICVMCDICVIG